MDAEWGLSCCEENQPSCPPFLRLQTAELCCYSPSSSLFFFTGLLLRDIATHWIKSNNQMIPVWRRTRSNISLRCCKHDFCARALKLTSQSVILPASTLWSTPSPSRSASSSWRLSRTCHWGWHRLLTLHCGSPLWRRRQDFSYGARSPPFSLSLLQPDTVDLNSKLPITALRPSGVF